MSKQLEMNRYRIERYNFIDVNVVPTTLSFAGFNYMSIITNGGINPDANYYEPAYPQFYFQIATDDHKYLINNEIRNFKLPVWFKKGIAERDKTDLIQPIVKIFNRKRTGATLDAETGYGEYYVIFSEDPIENWFMKKENPNFCITGEVPADTIVTYWFGIYKPVVGYILAIPWIPKGYKELSYCISRDSADLSISDFKGYCCRGTAQCQNIEVTSYNACIHINICTYRFKLELTNIDAVNPQGYCIHIGFINKSDSSV